MTAGQPRILIIDRDSGLRSYVEHILQGEYLVDQALSGTLAMAILQKRTYDFVIASTDMPAGSGFRGMNILNKIRAISDCQELPVILITSGTRVKVTALGRVVTIRKQPNRPVDEDTLRKALDEARQGTLLPTGKTLVARPILTAWRGTGV